MAEEAADVQASEITPEDFDGEQDTPKAESLPVEKTEAKAEEKIEEKTPEAVEEAQAEPEAKPDEAAKPEVEAEKPFAKAEDRKSQLTSEIRDLVSRRNALKAEVEKANAEVYQPATENELVDQGMSATEAKVEALRQEIEVSRYNERVAEAQLTISHESERVLQDFPMFNPENKDEYDEELAGEAATLLEANLIRDQYTGQVIGSNVSPYQLYKTLARASGLSTVKGQLKGQQDTEQMLASADAASSVAPVKKTEDPVIALWKED